MDEETTNQPEHSVSANLTEDFAGVYANNFHFEISAWDLKILLGQLNQLSGKPSIDWHTSVTMPWGAAKLLSYLLFLNITIYESQHGQIRLHPSTIPPPVNPPSGEDDNEQNRKFYAAAAKLHDYLTGDTIP